MVTGSDSTYTVLARRFRPQGFSDVVGQEHVAQALRNAIRANRVAHAYLFTGARGVGKTSTARILAKALNCPNSEDGNPCNECEICQGIAAGHDVDVLEIDGASNRGIDDIRQLRANVNVKSMRTRYKLYIIDEVHMLTKEAFNALLKTLEEPPPNVKFVFCTTEPNKVPDTILSRCQRFDFGTIETSNIKSRLRDIASAEGVDVDDDALELVARRAAGSMRDSQSIFDQLLAFGEEHISAEDVHRLLGTASDDRLIEIGQALVERDQTQALAAFHTALDGGVQLGELTDQLLFYLRDLMVIASGAGRVRLLSVAPGSRETLQKQAECWGLQTIVAAMQILADAKGRMQRVTYGRALAELALVRISLLENFIGLDGLIDQLRKSEPASALGASGSEAEKKNDVTPGVVSPALGDPQAASPGDEAGEEQPDASSSRIAGPGQTAKPAAAGPESHGLQSGSAAAASEAGPAPDQSFAASPTAPAPAAPGSTASTEDTGRTEGAASGSSASGSSPASETPETEPASAVASSAVTPSDNSGEVPAGDQSGDIGGSQSAAEDASVDSQAHDATAARTSQPGTPQPTTPQARASQSRDRTSQPSESTGRAESPASADETPESREVMDRASRKESAGSTRDVATAESAGIRKPGVEAASSTQRAAGEHSESAKIAFRPENASELWAQVVSQINDMTKSHVKTVSETAIFAPNRLELTLPRKYHFSKRYLEKPEALSRLEQIASELSGINVRITLVLSEHEPEAEKPSTESQRKREQQKREYKPEEDEFVSSVMETFSAQVVRVDPLTTSTVERETVEHESV